MSIYGDCMYEESQSEARKISVFLQPLDKFLKYELSIRYQISATSIYRVN